jgi:hypothetical protein
MVPYTGISNQAGLVTVAFNEDNVPQDAVLVLSSNDGNNYEALAFNLSHFGGGCQDCGAVDYPQVTADPRTHEIFAIWAHSESPWAEAIADVVCTSTTSCTAGEPIGLPSGLLAHNSVYNAPQARIGIIPSTTSSPATILITYASENFPYSPSGGPYDCSTDPPFPGNKTTDVSWFLITGKVGGTAPNRTYTWSGPKLIDEDKTWPACVMPKTGANNAASMPVLYDPLSGYIFTVHNKSQLRAGDSKAVGVRMFLEESTTGATGSWSSWVESCTSGKALETGTLPENEPFCNNFGPTLATTTYLSGGNAISRVATTFYSTFDGTLVDAGADSLVDIWAAAVKPGLPLDSGEFSVTLGPINSNVPWPLPCGTCYTGLFSYGDYQGLAADSAGNFVAVWADNRMLRDPLVCFLHDAHNIFHWA